MFPKQVQHLMLQEVLQFFVVVVIDVDATNGKLKNDRQMN